MSHCALCNSEDATAYEVSPRPDTVMLCQTCRTGLEEGPTDGPHWQCLNEAIWSTEPAVQVLAYRLLKGLPEAPWARDVLDIAYLEPDVLSWAEAGLANEDAEDAIVHVDCNGAVLAAGDTVTLIKDLAVKGAGFTAKRGTAVRKIALVPDNAAQIEGRVEGQRIVILTQFVKKA
ncbi:PhnA domain-containing protein [Stappia taiwanensis]|uniref:PhnA domain-containing protein n=1 Tax=Stappia taiwanensis TaxID=992267 RepID=A0A838XVW4_9HYPH|nr:alkylphosphonate utilization protein [Stappia taiwanensis]MBA4612748.1 PhnA domain-containing protein [Stappia taiwanensis]GGE90373.1 PhnA protein [Stappia taiwanensis]